MMNSLLHSLLVSCQEGDKEKVQDILNSGEVGVNASDESGITAAQVAAANDDVEVLKILREHHCNLNQENSVGWTPLHQACWHGHTGTVQFLLEQGVDTSKRNKFGSDALTIAAGSGHVSTVRLLLESGVKPEDPLPSEHRTCPSPGMSAALHGRDGVLRILLNRGMRPDAMSVPSRWTPLMFAAAGGSKAACQLLLERSADPNKLNLLGATALDIASGAGNTDIRVYLETKTMHQTRRIQTEDQDMDLIQAAREGDLEKVEELLSKEETNVDMQDQEGATPLILAAVGGFLSITQLLIGLGANLNHQDKVNGWTALMQATFFSHIDVVKTLLEFQADVSLTGFNGCTALDLATLVDDKDSALVRLLAAHTIMKVPPSLVLTPTRRPQQPRIAFQTRSFSEANLDIFEPSGLKGLWNKFSNKFRKNDILPRMSVRPASSMMEDENGLGIQKLVPQTSVYTLGFTSMGSSSSPYSLSTSPPNFRHMLHDTSCSPGKFCMPPGKEGENEDISLYPRSIKLLNTTISPSTSLSSQGTQRTTHSRRRNKKIDPAARTKELTVRGILKKLGLLHLLPTFQHHEVDVEVLLGVDDEDLVEIGVDSSGDRSKIMQYVKRYKT